MLTPVRMGRRTGSSRPEFKELFVFVNIKLAQNANKVKN